MKVIKFLGGLGNQMFQYAFYKSLEAGGYASYADLSDFKDYKLHNGFELERIFNVKLRKPDSLIAKLLKPNPSKWMFRKLRRVLGLKHKYKSETNEFMFDAGFYKAGNYYYEGYWQHKDYFNNIDPEIRKDFEFKTPLDNQNSVMLKSIEESNSVSIHIRRGDYINHELLGAICNTDYYNRAIAYMKSVLTAPVFYVFSDDVEWCKAHLEHHDLEFVYWNKGLKSYIDMQLMSNCKHNIIANSSFSWWAAWLNRNDQKIVVCPEKWIHNSDKSPVLKEWIKM